MLVIRRPRDVSAMKYLPYANVNRTHFQILKVSIISVLKHCLEFYNCDTRRTERNSILSANFFSLGLECPIL